ncbi:MAG: AMP-binding protein [Saprospiraceae bacterium]|nr:AMP-binding protein [Saprospiraceae bacterium]
MQGYFKKPALTQAVINQDGWLEKTGDIGRIDRKQIYVQITDRIKRFSKTSPRQIHCSRHLCSYILQNPLLRKMPRSGFNDHFVTALVVPNF